MLKRSVLVLFVCFILVGFASAVDVVMIEPSSSLATISVTSANNLYAYEVRVDYTGTIGAVSFAGFLGAGTSSGHNEKSSVSYVYESKLDSGKTGVSGSGALFNITHTGTIHLTSAVFISNISGEEETDYTYCGDRACDAGETCSSCSGDCGDCATTATPSGGGGGGGGSASVAAITQAKSPVENLAIDIKDITLDLVLNSNKKRILKITNNGNKEEIIYLGQTGLDGLVLFEEDSITLVSGESREIKVTFLALEEPGIYAGKLLIGGKQVLTSISVRSKQLLFDALIAIPDDNKQIKFGDKLDTQITLIPMGGDSRVDVTINYIVKDFDGKIHISESETILITEQKNFKKEISTKNLPVGNYIVGLELIYPNGVATSSSHFEVVEEDSFNIKTILVILIGGIFALIILIMIFFIRYKKHRKHFLGKRK